MKPSIVNKAAVKIIGIEVRTNNKDEMSGNGKIGLQWQKFYQEEIGNKIPNQNQPNEVLAIYTDYASDENGEYSFILAKEVRTFDVVPTGMVAKTLPPAKYAVFTSSKGVMPSIVIDLWKYIWSLKSDELGSNRAYLGDYEVYDGRSVDPNNSQVDIFISIK